MDAYEHLGLIIGETARDDLADKIFKEFCMGNRLQDIRYWKEDICMPVLNEEYDVVVVGQDMQDVRQLLQVQDLV